MIVWVCVPCSRMHVRARAHVNEERLLVFVCVCIYVCVHTSHLHGAMPHCFHWGMWEQRLSISSAAVPAGKSLIIISWMMSLRHAPHSRPVAASLQHPSLLLSLFSPFSLFLFLAFSLYSLSLTCAVYCFPYIFSPLSPFLFPAFIILCLHLTPWIWLTLSSIVTVFFSLSLSAPLTHFLSSISSVAGKSSDGTRLTFNCLVEDQTQTQICIFKRQHAECMMTLRASSESSFNN